MNEEFPSDQLPPEFNPEKIPGGSFEPRPLDGAEQQELVDAIKKALGKNNKA